jgi:hypothetical protein
MTPRLHPDDLAALIQAVRDHTPWLDKRAIAEHFDCSVRSIEYALADGLPHAIIFGRPKFQVNDVEAWLKRTGRLERRGSLPSEEETWPDSAGTPPGRRHEEVSPHVHAQA